MSNNVECKIKLFIHYIKIILNDNEYTNNEKEKNILFLINMVDIIIKNINKFKNKENTFKNLDIHIDDYYIKKENSDLYINKEEIMEKFEVFLCQISFSI